MKNRYRVEIYDENKANDLTIYSEQGVDKEYLTELVFSNMRKFDGDIRAYVYDNLKKKKTTALMISRSCLPAKTKLTNLLAE
jgi:hypothetical protein